MSEWYESWFDTKYYHILYKHRDEHEAKRLLENLVRELPVSPPDKVLDLACGTGRHSIQLSEMGFEVTGVDLSPRNIAMAKKKDGAGKVRFVIHDMREVFEHEEFDVILNLFTSFGYFDADEDNLKTLKAAHANLKSGGKLLIDFLNVNNCMDSQKMDESITVEGIQFEVSKQQIDGKIRKDIRFEDGGEKYEYREELQLLTLNDFEQLFSRSGFKLLKTFGDYEFQPFSSNSDRLILLAQKI